MSPHPRPSEPRLRRVPLVVAGQPAEAALACERCEVRPGALFGALDPVLLARAHGGTRPARVAAEQPLFERRGRGREVYTIRSGLVRLERITERGDRRIVRLAGRGDLVGQEALLGEPHTDDAIACGAVEVCVIPVDVVDELSALAPTLRRNLMWRWQQALDAASAWTTEVSTGPARRRLLKLLELLLHHAGDGPLWLPRRELLGAMLDVALETASRLVSQLRLEGVLELLPGQAARVDRAALARALDAAND